MGWRGDARSIIRRYPELKSREAALRDPKITPRYAASAGGTVASRTTEDAALRELPPQEQRALDAVALAISTTRRYSNADLRLRLVDLVYWEQSNTLEGAAALMFVSVEAAKRWHAAFVELVDAYYRIL